MPTVNPDPVTPPHPHTPAPLPCLAHVPAHTTTHRRIRNKQRLATEFDIVVTTYATLGSDFGGKKNQGRADSPLGGIKWHRIVFDEGEGGGEGRGG